MASGQNLSHPEEQSNNYFTVKRNIDASGGRVYNGGQATTKHLIQEHPFMKRLLCVPAFIFLFAVSAPAQNYSIDWFTIDGGGGTSSGGAYTLSGTIGQPDAGRMSGGNYSIDGGFWGILAAVQTPGSPLLRIFLTATNTVIVAWPTAAGGFNLEQNSNLATTAWSTVTNSVNVVGSENQVSVAPPSGSKFYRLRYP
jgi:hypothetical protein